MIIKSQLKTGYEKIQYIIFFIFIKNEYITTHEIKKIKLTIKLIFHYQVR